MPASAQEPPRIIVVDDDPELRELLTEFLVGNGLDAEAVPSGAALRARLTQCQCDVVILDMMMPGEDGLSVLRSLTHGDDPPSVIMLSALSSDVDRIVALEMGADDYVTKPSNPREILARVRSVLRRRQHVVVPANTGGEASPGWTYLFSGWVLNTLQRIVRAPSGAVVPLTDTEFDILTVFVLHPLTVHSREDVIALSRSGEAAARDRTVDVNISRLRRKMAAADPREVIRTVRGKGYLLTSEVATA